MHGSNGDIQMVGTWLGWVLGMAVLAALAWRIMRRSPGRARRPAWHADLLKHRLPAWQVDQDVCPRKLVEPRDSGSTQDEVNQRLGSII